ncbi:MAG TPA: DUF1254 domain-containing protein [Streptosporangiaceae bacterium]|jgi:hypothetical protein
MAADWLRATTRAAADGGRAALAALRHPDQLMTQARKLQQAAPLLRQAVTPILTGQVTDWAAEHAYTAGVQAFVYGFPYIYYAQLRHEWVTDPRNSEFVPYAAVGSFWHARHLTHASYRDGGSPNNDTLYSMAWLDLRDGPVVLSHPDMGNRYFTFQIAAVTSDTVDYVGQRTTGGDAGNFAILGPGWHGQLPEGIRATQPSPTPWVLVLGRTAVDGPDDVPAARELQLQYRLTPLASWPEPGAAVPARRDVYAPAPPGKDPLGPWRTLNAMLAENPPPARHAVLLEQFTGIGIGPGRDVDAQPEPVRRGLARAAATGMALLRAQFASGNWATSVNGWRYPPPQMGHFGDDFLSRAADQCLAGIAVNEPAEAVYLLNFADADGAPLAPEGHYELRFGAGDLPPVDAFWSLTAYTAADMNLIPNPAGRYSVGDRTPELRRDPDGGLTLHLQPGSPGTTRAPNWLSTSAGHPWFVILRLYRPRPQVVQAAWRCPGLRRVS